MELRASIRRRAAFSDGTILKLLVSAYSCEPGYGSEPGVGWNTARELARRHEVWVLTRPDESRTRIEDELRRDPAPGLHMVYVSTPILPGLWRRGQSGAMQIHYHLWQVAAYFVARRLHRKVGFDTFHHVTFGKYSTPSFLAFLPVPGIFGPVGGAESAPLGFWRTIGARERIYELARELWRRVGEMDPFTRLAARRYALVLARTRETADRMRILGARHVRMEPGEALPSSEIQRLGDLPAPPQAPIRFLSVGRLLHWKGFALGLQAFAAAGLKDAEYWIIGEGPDGARLRRVAESLGIAPRVRMFGRLQRPETLQKMSEAHVLVHPSFHDSGPTVAVEAMAARRPVIALDLGGPGATLAGGGGILVPAQSPESAVRGLAEAMRRLAEDGELRRRMGEEARLRGVTEFSWESRGRRFADLHAKLAGSRGLGAPAGSGSSGAVRP